MTHNPYALHANTTYVSNPYAEGERLEVSDAIEARNILERTRLEMGEGLSEQLPKLSTNVKKILLGASLVFQRPALFEMLLESLEMGGKFEFDTAFEPQNFIESRPILELTFQSAILSNDEATVKQIL